MTYSILRVIWILLHVLYTIIQHIVFMWVSVRKKCEELFSQDSINDDIGFVSKHVKLLVKIPAHVAVIIGNEPISFNDLANITVWCLAAGISFVSFYDHNGILKKNEVELADALSKLRKEYVKNITWGKTSSFHDAPKKNGINGFSLKKLTVNVFSLSDGKGSLVEIAKSLCPAILAGDIKCSDIDLPLINSLLHKKLSIPDVDIAVCCGSVCSPHGFLPWHTRVTEFLQLQSHHNIAVKDFTLLLDVYSKCNQRFGK